MNTRKLLAAIALMAPLALAACQTSSQKDNGVTYNQIKTLTAFQGGVVGKKLVNPDSSSDSYVIAANNTWGGSWKGKEMSGQWKWEDGYWCRTINTGDPDCQKFEMSSKFNGLRVTRRKGTGNSFYLDFGK